MSDVTKQAFTTLVVAIMCAANERFAAIGGDLRSHQRIQRLIDSAVGLLECYEGPFDEVSAVMYVDSAVELKLDDTLDGELASIDTSRDELGQLITWLMRAVAMFERTAGSANSRRAKQAHKACAVINMLTAHLSYALEDNSFTGFDSEQFHHSDGVAALHGRAVESLYSADMVWCALRESVMILRLWKHMSRPDKLYHRIECSKVLARCAGQAVAVAMVLVGVTLVLKL